MLQIDPIKSTLKAPGTKRSKLKCYEPLSILAFDFNLRRYTLHPTMANNFQAVATGTRVRLTGRGLHSSTFQLNLSRF